MMIACQESILKQMQEMAYRTLTSPSLVLFVKQFMWACVAFTLIGFVMGTAYAWEDPATSMPGYPLYDIFVNQGVKGPIGMMGGVALVMWGGNMIKESVWKGAGAAIGGAAIVKADDIAQSIGMLMQ